jgi:hypothetical protein
MSLSCLLCAGYSGIYVAISCGIILQICFVLMVVEARKAFDIFDIERMWRGDYHYTIVSLQGYDIIS